MGEITRIVLADDHAVVRAGLELLLGREPDLAVVGEAGTGDEAVRLCETLRPDLLLLDVSMPGDEQFAALRAVRARVPQTRVLLLTMHEDETLLREALRLGALVERYVHPEHCTCSGPRSQAPDGLTAREREVLTLAAGGYANKEVAAKFSISVKTVEPHRTDVNEKLGLRSRVDLIPYARRHGLLDELS